MYMHFYGLSERPFSTVPDTTFLFKSKQYLDAYNHLLYGIHSKQGFMALVGDVGTGKTTLCRALLHALEGKMETALIFNPPQTSIELLRTILQDLGQEASGSSKSELLESLNAYLLRCSSAGKGVVIIMDEAQNLPEDVMEELRLLSNLETEKEKLIQIILSGQTELIRKLSRDALRQLYQRIAVWAHLKPLTRKDVGHYIYHRLLRAGSSGSVTFTGRALMKIYRYSGGIPRRINLICDKALLAGYVAQKKKITGSIVNEAIKNAGDEQLSSPLLALRTGYAVILGCVLMGFFIAGLLTDTLNVPLRFPWNAGVEAVHYARAKMPDSLLSIPRPVQQHAVSEETNKNPEPPVQNVAVVISGAFDSNGVMRQDKKDECAPEALATLLALWTVSEESLVRAIYRWNSTSLFSFTDSIKMFNLSVAVLDTTLEQIRILAYPCIIPINDTHYRYVVLAGIIGNQAVLLDPQQGKTSIPVEQLHSRWTGKAFIVWKDFDSLPSLLRKGDVHPKVVTIKEKLPSQEIPLQSPATKLFDQSLEDVVKALQTRFSLKADGIVGSYTKLAFYRAVYPMKIPRLQ